MRKNDVLVIVPALNESENVGRVVAEIFRICPQVDVVVVDDGSVDRTAQEARAAGAVVISLPFNLGIGGAVQTGFQFAQKNGYTIAIQIDGDGQHDAQFVPALLHPLQEGAADLVVGSRFIPPFLGYRSSFVRRIGIHFFAWLISFLTRSQITDSTSGFRACNAKAIALFADNYPEDFPEPESIVSARQVGLRVVEVPVAMRERLKGTSSIRYLRTLYYMVKVTFAILLDMLKKKELGCMNTKVLAFGFLLWLLIFVIDLVRREQLTFKYASGWILLALAGMILVTFDQLIAKLSVALGFQLSSNFIFVCAVAGGVLMSLFLTIFLCQQNSRNDRMAQKIGILEEELDRLKKRNKQ